MCSLPPYQGKETTNVFFADSHKRGIDMSYRMTLEESYNRDYRFLPSGLLMKKMRGLLTNDDLIVASVLREIESSAANRKSPKWDQTSVYFDITLCTMKLKYGFTSYRTKLSLKQLFKAGVITDPSYETIRFTKDYSGYEKNKNFKEKLSFHARKQQGLRIPRFLDQYDSLKASDKIAFSLLLRRAMENTCRSEDGTKYVDFTHEEMLEKLAIKSVTSLLSIYNRLEAAGLIRREKKSVRFYFPLLTKIIKIREEKSSPEKSLQTACDLVPTIIFSTSNFVSDLDSEIAPTIKNTSNNKEIMQNSLSSETKVLMEQERAEDEDATAQPLLTPTKEHSTIHFDRLIDSYPNRAVILNNLKERVDFVYSCRSSYIFVGGRDVPTHTVRDRLSRLTDSDILSISSWLKDYIADIAENRRDNYTLTILFNYNQTRNWKRQKKTPNFSSTSRAYQDNKYIPSNNYDYDAILEEHRKRLWAQYDENKKDNARRVCLT